MRPAIMAIWALAALPLLIASGIVLEVRWDSPHDVLATAGRLAGVAGLACLLVSACLSSRVPGFDRIFGGLTRLWQTHHLLGACAFLLLLAHPLLLAFARAESNSDARELLFPAGSSWALWSGWAGLLLMMIFLAPSFSFFGPPVYQRWKAIHMLAGPAIVFSLLHAFAYDRAIAPPWDYLVWGTLSALALAALGYRWIFSRWRLPGTAGGRFHYRVTGVDTVSQGVVEIAFAPVSGAMRYEAGQFGYLTPYDRQLEAGYGQEHPFTISSSPHEPDLRMTVKNLGDASRALQQIQPGSDVRIEGPYGAFFQDNSQADDLDELWIAGGIGITPFLARARYLQTIGNTGRVCLIFCVQDEARALFLDELTQIAASMPAFSFHMHYFYKEGPLSREFIEQRCETPASRDVYICGPNPLLALGRSIASDTGVPFHRIHTEEFNLL